MRMFVKNAVKKVSKGGKTRKLNENIAKVLKEGNLQRKLKEKLENRIGK